MGTRVAAPQPPKGSPTADDQAAVADGPVVSSKG